MQFLATEQQIVAIISRIWTCSVFAVIGTSFLLLVWQVLIASNYGQPLVEEDQRSMRLIVVISLPVGIALAMAGYMIGLARETVVGDLLPAFVALASGLLAYFFQNIRGIVVLLSVAVLVGTLEIFSAATLGAMHRDYSEKQTRMIIHQEEIGRRMQLRNLNLE